ncbi:hypothetical protein [Paracoccus aerodenitrificans]|uniref:hypothetical protein n=1 Tax=Paracoccus aerodenitrificans TaxID=3017781 RepID=UPI0022F06D17|nr:hypothetical protein [Paracoccus aerodenitrificans]WBU63190.1 hypothetical protein PAE61_12575 [Paracoccus aerodenitrificans]
MLKNECSRNCWLAAGICGLLVWIFNGTFFGGLLMGLIAFFLLGKLFVWGVCQGRGGLREDQEVLGETARTRHSADPDPAEAGILGRAEQAVVDAGQAIAATAAAAVDKGRDALDDDDDDREDDDDDRDNDDDDGLLDRAEDRLEQAGDAVKEAMGALAVRGKKALSSLTDNDDDREETATDEPGKDGRRSGTSGSANAAQPAALYDARVSEAPEAASDAGTESTNVSPSGQSAIPARDNPAEDTAPAKPAGKAKADKPAKSDKKKKSDKAEKTAKAKKSGKAEKSGKSDKSAKSAKKKSAKKVEAASPAAASSDDLKEIKGIGPQLEGVLHENGVTSFSQIAGWSDADIDHFAGLIGRMGGRIRSDDWVEQARILAAGGETEFSKRVDKGEVY